jgi:hypothetical protein
MADTTTIEGGNSAQNKFYDYYNQLKTQLQTNPNTINYTPIQVEQQSLEGLSKQIADYLRPYTDSAIRQRQAQTDQYRAEADVDAASRGMGSSTWLTDSKNRMSNAEAADIADLESTFQSNVGEQAFNSFQQYLQNKLSADTTNASNQLETDEFNAKLYQTLEELAYARAGDMYGLTGSGSGSGSASKSTGSVDVFSPSIYDATGAIKVNPYLSATKSANGAGKKSGSGGGKNVNQHK